MELIHILTFLLSGELLLRPSHLLARYSSLQAPPMLHKFPIPVVVKMLAWDICLYRAGQSPFLMNLAPFQGVPREMRSLAMKEDRSRASMLVPSEAKGPLSVQGRGVFPWEQGRKGDREKREKEPTVPSASLATPGAKHVKVEACAVSTPPPTMSTSIDIETMDVVPNVDTATSEASTPTVSETGPRARFSSKIPSSMPAVPLGLEVYVLGVKTGDPSLGHVTVLLDSLALRIRDSAIDVPSLATIGSSTPPPSTLSFKVLVVRHILWLSI
ncbi:hypothetical protein AMTR_s00075p00168760 [Amborella trichopoda]|uniref:Uncharacterized protein n=1 Tax=Amborella trichopoda TaxID=13333 RepID=W1P401_AMBTC|nr:hypothetical protein AMTR_s00075p00168760 [Amborella trichopoda]